MMLAMVLRCPVTKYYKTDMELFKRFLIVALVSGTLSGSLLSVMHLVGVVPLILEAEIYEKSMSETLRHDQKTMSQHHDGAWFPDDGFERTFYTLISNIIFSIALVLMLVAIYSTSEKKPAWYGVGWGLAGFVIFYLAPTLVYRPTLPGAIEVDLLLRQLWWIATVEGTAFGLAIIVFSKHWFLKTLGVMLVILPQLVGSPPGEVIRTTPETLMNSFFLINFITNLLYWTFLGFITVYIYNRLHGMSVHSVENNTSHSDTLSNQQAKG